MIPLPFYILDVFAEKKFAGNPLAVFRNAGSLSAETMQSIAREINYSETTFILSDEMNNGGYDVRIFTPGEEVPFAGHPTLGTAQVIRDQVLSGQGISVRLNLKIGQIPVTFLPDGTSWMQQKAPTFGPLHAVDELAPVLCLPVADLDASHPIQEVSTGLPFFIVPLTSLAALKRARIDREKYDALIENTTAKGILVFCPEPHSPGNDLSVRVFVDYYGVPEDPATGSGNGCLAAYLVAQRYFGTTKIDLRCEQGYEIGRPSLLLLRAEKKGAEFNISVGGKSILVAQGEFV